MPLSNLLKSQKVNSINSYIFIFLDPREDVYDFEKIVVTFKNFMNTQEKEIKHFSSSVDARLFDQGYHFEVASRKSDHHARMENYHAIVEDLFQFTDNPNGGPMTSFFGVFDGHGGFFISEYLSFHLATRIAQQTSFSTKLPEALREAFFATDNDVLKRISRDVRFLKEVFLTF